MVRCALLIQTAKTHYVVKPNVAQTNSNVMAAKESTIIVIKMQNAPLNVVFSMNAIHLIIVIALKMTIVMALNVVFKANASN